MSTTFPAAEPGPALADLRTSVGISQGALAKRLGVSRQTVISWEQRAAVPALKAHRYRRALREMVDEATGGPVA